MSEQELMEAFLRLGKLTEEEGEPYRELVLGCWERLNSRLRPGVGIEQNRRRLVTANAMMSMRQLRQMQGEYQSVKVGDISFSDKGTDSRPEEELIADLLDTQGVSVKGVAWRC